MTLDMKILIGLGNPGHNYENTRHNAGFLCIDAFQRQHEFPAFTEKKKFFAHITEKTFLNGEKVMLVKPTTFMNNSGRAVGAVMHYYNSDPSDVIIIHDDLDIEIGHYKKTCSAGAAGHNGVQDIIDCTGAHDFMRIRIGVETAGGRQSRGMISGKDFVLQPFTATEKERLNDVITTIIHEEL